MARKERANRVLAVRVTDTQMQMLQGIADANDWSISQIVRSLIAQYLEPQEEYALGDEALIGEAPEAGKTGIVLAIRFSEDEAKELADYCARYGLKLTEFGRGAILDRLQHVAVVEVSTNA